MDLETARKLIELERRMDGLITPERSPDLISPFLALPGLVGFWPMSSVQRSTGNAYDLSGQGRTLTYNGNPTYNVYNNRVAYIDLDGAGDYLSRLDETDLDVLGTEATNAAAVRGLTWGGWFWSDEIAATAGLISKQDGGLAYVLVRTAANVEAVVDGGAGAVGSGTIALNASQWYFIVGRFTPSTELKVWANASTNRNIVGILAAVQNVNAALTIGMQIAPATNPFNGRAALCFLCANAVPDALISSLFQQTRGAFGV